MIPEITILTVEFCNIAKLNAPVRTNPPAGPCGLSPFPGNLRNNGINYTISGSNARITIGGSPAPYGPYTETKSHKPGWIDLTITQFCQGIITRYGGSLTEG